jgi:hypothetical protein
MPQRGREPSGKPRRENRSRVSHKDGRPGEMITISRDRLNLIIETFFHARRAASGWESALGIAISLWVILPITTFVDRAGLKADEWRLLVILAAMAATGWCIISFIRSWQAPMPDDLLDEILNRSDVIDDHRALYLLKAIDRENCYRILAYWDIVWQCYLLPHADIRTIDIRDPATLESLSTYASRQLGAAPDSVELRHLADGSFQTRKFSEFYKREKSYTFDIMHVRLHGDIPNHLLKEEFIVGGRKFRWATLATLEAHVDTGRKNGDVIRHLENNFTRLFMQYPDTVVNGSLHF